VRAEDVSPRTWLLAALAGWALLAWVLALAGMGGRVAPLAGDPALLQQLPQLRAAAGERLGPYGQYDNIASRPLFSEDRRPKPFSLRGEGEEEQPDAFDYVLSGVLLTPGLKLAILQPAAPDGAPGQASGGESVRIKLGESAERPAGWRLVSLQPRSAVFEGPEGQRTLELRAYDGSGGQPATPASRPGATRPSGRSERPAVIARQADDAAQAAQAAADAANASADSAAASADSAIAPPPSRPPEPPVAEPDAAPQTPDAQIEAIRKRIQARREQLRREAPQPTGE
jgi:general secretion pathway protein N